MSKLAVAFLRWLVLSTGAGVLILEPLGHLHTVLGNDNIAMQRIMREFDALPKELNISVALLRHARKRTNTPGDRENAAGAVAIYAIPQMTLTLTTMTPADAKRFRLPEGVHRNYLCLDDGRQSDTAPGEPAGRRAAHHAVV